MDPQQQQLLLLCENWLCTSCKLLQVRVGLSPNNIGISLLLSTLFLSTKQYYETTTATAAAV
jgi:hypothetical protein